jgi:hypothetical protein
MPPMSAALDIMGLIAPAAPAAPPGGAMADSPDRGFRALLGERMAAAETEDATAVDGPADPELPGLKTGTDRTHRDAEATAGEPPGRGLALGKAGGGALFDRLDGPVDPEVVADLRARLARGEDIGAEGLALLLSAAAAERSAVGQAALLSGQVAGTPSPAGFGPGAGVDGAVPQGPTSAGGAAAAAPEGALPDDLAQALGRMEGKATGPADQASGNQPEEAELLARAEAKASGEQQSRARAEAAADMPDPAQAALARQIAEGRPGAAQRAVELAEPNGAALGLRVSAEGSMAGFGDGGFGQGGFGQSGSGQTALPDGLAAGAAASTGAERAGSTFAGMVQMARAGATAQAVIDQVSVAISKAGGAEGSDRVTVQLKPASLGSIEVQLDVADDGRVQAHIVADKAETLDMLRNDARSLARALADAGLQTDSGSLNFSLKGDDQQHAQGGGDGGNGRGPGVEGDEPVTDAAPALTETWTVADDRLDIRV